MRSIQSLLLIPFLIFLTACEDKNFEGKLFLNEPMIWVHENVFDVIVEGQHSARVTINELNQADLYLLDFAPVTLDVDVEEIQSEETFKIKNFSGIYDLVGKLGTATTESKAESRHIICSYSKTERVCGEHEMRSACYDETTFHIGWKKQVTKQVASRKELMIYIYHGGSTNLVGQFQLFPVKAESTNVVEYDGECLPHKE